MQWTDRIGLRLKLRDLHILLAVAKSGSMGKAAADLAISQPSVSKAIAEVEHAVGLRLLDRGAHGIEPTIYAGHCSSAASPCSMSSGRASNRSNFSPTRGQENCGLVAAKAWPQASYPSLLTGSLGSTRGRCFMSCQRIPPRSS